MISMAKKEVKAEVKAELKPSGKPVIKKEVKTSKPKTEMRMLGGRLREVEVGE